MRPSEEAVTESHERPDECREARRLERRDEPEDQDLRREVRSDTDADAVLAPPDDAIGDELADGRTCRTRAHKARA
jgi:hypothetical protein